MIFDGGDDNDKGVGKSKVVPLGSSLQLLGFRGPSGRGPERHPKEKRH